MVGVAPPLEVMEPEPVTEVTVPAEVVAIILPFASTAKTEEVKPLPKDNWVMVVVARVEAPVTDRVPPTVKRLEIVVEPLTVNVLPPTKVKLELVASGLEPLPNRISLAVTAWEPVPPLATGRIPVTLAVRSMVAFWMSPLTIREEDNRPALLLWTTPAVLKAVMVGAWDTVRLVMVVVAKVEMADTDKVPPTVKRLEIVAEPVMPKVLLVLFQRKLAEEAVVEAPVA
jgi:hypothetical protein